MCSPPGWNPQVDSQVSAHQASWVPGECPPECSLDTHCALCALEGWGSWFTESHQ